MRRLLSSLWLWMALLTLMPLLLWQVRQARKTIPRLPEAAGETYGLVAGAGKPLRVLLVGESTAVGVGVQHLQDALPGHLSRGLAARLQRPVIWQLIGKNGATLRELRQLLEAATLQPFDLMVLAAGVNDTKSFKSPARWTRDLRELISHLHQYSPDASFYICAMPPLGQFPALPQPLRHIIGLQAQRLDRATQAFCHSHSAAKHIDSKFPMQADFFASDGFHPSAQGYAWWAKSLIQGMDQA